MPLIEPLIRHAETRGSHPAIIRGDWVISYGELYPLVCAIADRLASAGVSAGEIVAIRTSNNAHQLLLLYAIMRLGGAAMPTNPAWTPVETTHFMTSLGVRFLITDAQSRAIAGASHIHPDESWWRPGTDGSTAETWPVIGDAPALLLLSSGTTGMPKATLVTAGLVLQRLEKIKTSYGVCRDDRYLAMWSMHIGLARNASMTTLLQGGTVVFGDAVGGHPLPPDETIIRAVTSLDITYLNLYPTLARLLLRRAGGAEMLLPSLRVLVITSAALSAQERLAIRRRLCANFAETYSATEGGMFTFATPQDQQLHPDSVGRVPPGIELEIVDEEHRPLPPGTTGVIRVQGAGVATGYYRNSEATERAFHDGWFYPGDLGVMNAAGYLFLKGRRDDVINCDGLKIHPVDVEACLLSHPAVADAAVVGIESSPMREVPIAFVVLRTRTSKADLLAHCRTRLAAYEIPRRIVAVREMPKTSSGKVIKARLREALQRAITRPDRN